MGDFDIDNRDNASLVEDCIGVDHAQEATSLRPETKAQTRARVGLASEQVQGEGINNVKNEIVLIAKRTTPGFDKRDQDKT